MLIRDGTQYNVPVLCNFVLADPGICICRTISLILQDFACFWTILCGSAPKREFRHPEINSESNIYHELKEKQLSDSRSTTGATGLLTPRAMVLHF